MYPMIYPELGSIGAMAVEEGGEMCIKYVKKSLHRESLEQNNGEPEGFLANRIKNIQGEGVP